MAVEIVMPKLGMAMKEGVVSVWNKEVGDPVGMGEPIASVNSEKIEIDVESPAEGTVLKITVPEGEGVPPGTVIAYIGDPSEEIIPSVESIPVEASEKAEIPTAVAADPVTINKFSNRRVRISPVARKMAEAANLDLSNVQGTGPGGRITKEDVQEAIRNKPLSNSSRKAAESTKAMKDDGTSALPVSGMRKVIAARMFDSLQNSAQLTITMKVDITDLKLFQKQTVETLQKAYENKLSLTDFIARAAVLSLQQHPQMNSAYIDETIQVYQHIHLGMAVALEKGLVVPVIRDANNCTLIELSRKIKTLAQKARQAQMASEEMQGSTFTITSLGMYDVEFFTPILNPPETAILGVGKASDTPIYSGEQLVRRTILPLSLTFDHRVVDGAPASAFMQTLKKYLEEPITLLL